MITYYELFSPLCNVWIDQLSIPASDVTTQKPGSDFDRLIVQTFV